MKTQTGIPYREIVDYLNDFQVNPGDPGEEQNHIEVILKKIGIVFISEEQGWQLAEHLPSARLTDEEIEKWLIGFYSEEKSTGYMTSKALMQRVRRYYESALPDVRDQIISLIPDTWLDPLLTGKNKVIGEYPFNERDIEKLLKALRDRIEKHFAALRKK
jgi:hypothetical protein